MIHSLLSSETKTKTLTNKKETNTNMDRNDYNNDVDLAFGRKPMVPEPKPIT